MRRILLVAAAAAVLASCSDDPATVAMTNSNRFEPADIQISAGEQIVFLNSADGAHSVTAYEDLVPRDGEYFASGAFDGEREARDHIGEALIAPNEEFTITLEVPGTYRYFCIPHESQGMTGRIVVK